MNYPEFLTYLKAQRQNRHITIDDMGKILQCSKNTYNDYELGKRPIPFITALDLIHYYGHDLDIIKKKPTTHPDIIP